MRRALLAVLVSAVAVAAAGCGGAKETLDPVAAAAENSATSGGFRAEMTMNVTSAGDEGELTLDLSDVLEQSGAPAGTDGEMTMLSLNEDGHLVYYMQIPMFGSFLPAGKTWLRVDATEAGSAMGVDLDQLMS